MKKSEWSARIHEVLIDGEWVTGHNVLGLIKEVDKEHALFKPYGLNNLASLTFHLNYYVRGICDVLKGLPLTIRDAYSFDMPAVESESQWEEMKRKLALDVSELTRLVDEMEEEDLSSDFVDPKYGTWSRNLNVLIEHSYYHLGQMVLIKKLVFEEKQ